ncbi:MAG: FeoA family protein [Acutalibacteraceae bacterium]|nr:FeoA family protein [Acutalibacteraceae bacterium]
MSKRINVLNQVPLGEKCVVEKLLSEGKQRRRLLDLGLTKGTVVEVVQKSPFGNLRAYEIRGAVIALRKDDSDKVMVVY